jgi:hypothetical protein
MSPRALWITLAVLLVLVLVLFTMAMASFDLNFLRCHGRDIPDDPDPVCRRAVHYAYGALTALGTAILAAGTLIYRWIRR